jgi:hypothetical protein
MMQVPKCPRTAALRLQRQVGHASCHHINVAAAFIVGDVHDGVEEFRVECSGGSGAAAARDD